MRDRGHIKWTSMMLPEHKKRLSDLYKQQFHRSKPDLDEQKIEELNDIIYLALNDERPFKVTFHQDHTYHSVTGTKLCESLMIQTLFTTSPLEI